LAVCVLCGKRTVSGRNIRHKHSGRWQMRAPKTGRHFRPNIHRKTILMNGNPQRVTICTRCLRTQAKSVS